MPERVRRIATNEALFRMVNAEIEKLRRSLGDVRDGTLHIVCECGDLACSELIVVPTAHYERIRADDTLFFVEPGHEKDDVEHIVERTERYHIVQKHDPEAVAIVREQRARRD